MDKIFNYIEEVAIIFDKNGSIEFCNDKLLLLLKYSMDELQNKNICNCIFNNNSLSSRLALNIDKYIDKEYIIKMFNRDGLEVKVKGIISCIQWNKKKRYVIVANEIKEKKSLEYLTEQLNCELKRRKDTEEELKNFLSTAADLKIIVSDTGIFEKVNIGWNVPLEWKKEEMINNSWRGFVEESDIKKIEAVTSEGRKNSSLIKIQSKFLCKSGKYRLMDWRGIYIKESKKFVATARDITDEKRLEEEKIKYEEALKIETIKNEFFANMSHEFKTPLNIILSTIQLINLMIENEQIVDLTNFKLKKYINSIKQNSYRLLRLVNNIIDITKIDIGYYNIHLENHNIINIVEEITNSVVEYVEGKKISLTFDTEIEEMVVACDPEKIERIILNLISNAIKYTGKNGKIEVGIKVRDKVLISVRDNGIGIEKEQQKVIFDRFKQVDNTFTRKVEGSGIGLSLVKSLVEMHEGEIWVNSEVGKGTEFIFSIPIRNVEENKDFKISNVNIESRIQKCNIEFSDIYEF